MVGRVEPCTPPDGSPSCGGQVLLVRYIPDPARTPRDPGRRGLSTVVVDAAPAEDQDDEKANYAVSADRTRAHRITDDWPLTPPERRYYPHQYTCARRRAAAAATTGGAA